MSTLQVGTIKSASSAAPVIQNSSGTEKGQFAKAWVNFNGDGSNIRASFNVSSFTDHGTGQYTITLTNAFSNTNFTVSGWGGRSNNDANLVSGEFVQNRTTSSIKVITQDVQNNVRDNTQACYVFHGVN
mgnify:FL=1